MDKMRIDQCTVTLTRKCNLRCVFCYAKKTEYVESNTIEYDSLKKIIDFCGEAKVKYVVFTGGEPTLYPRLLDILEYIKNKDYKMIPAIATNGVLLENNEYCRVLLDSGIKYVDISLKGKDDNECCKMVGRDCFVQQSRAIRNLSTLDIEFTCSIVLTDENIYSLCDTVRNAYNNGAKQFSFTFAIDNEKSEDNDELYLKKHNPFAIVEAFVAQIEALNSITKEWWVEYSFPMCVYTSEQLSILEGKLAYPCQIHIDNGITFDTEMNLIPCNMYFENKIGQLGVDFSSYKEFKEIIQKPIYRSTLDRLKQFPANECISCEHLKLCYGGCSVIWKNYSYETIKKLKEEYYK